MLALFLSAFATLFVVIDPPGCAPIYAGLTRHRATPRQAFVMAARACLIASGILVVFALFGEDLLGALHIELDSFRIAGGIMLFLIALDMVFEKRTERREERAEKVRTAQPRSRGRLGLPHGHADAGGAGLDRVCHAADGAGQGL